MDLDELKNKIAYLVSHIPEIKNTKIRLQQTKHLHRLQKQVMMYKFLKGELNGSRTNENRA